MLIVSLNRINIRENRRGDQKLTIQKNWQHWAEQSTTKHKRNKNTAYVGYHYTQANTDNVFKI